MPQVLTTNALIICPHGGVGTSIPTEPKWAVQGGLVLVENDTGTLACPFVPVPCVGYQLRSMGLNAMRIGSKKVILTTDFNQTQTGLPLTMTESHQVLDNTTPAPIPIGQSAPPLSAELLDVIKPIVTAAPPALAFNSVTMAPTSLATTFTLTSAFPLLWKLTQINEPQASSADITNGIPPGLTVAPSGGDWNASPLAITVTMTAAYMAALGVGLHHFYMTGVSKRGLSGNFEVVLTVT